METNSIFKKCSKKLTTLGIANIYIEHALLLVFKENFTIIVLDLLIFSYDATASSLAGMELVNSFNILN